MPIRSPREHLRTLALLENPDLTVEQQLQAIAPNRDANVPADELEIDRRVLTYLLGRQRKLRGALEKSREVQEQFKAIVDKLSATPWHPATFLGFVEVESERLGSVQHGSARRAVSISERVDSEKLVAGDEVLLSHELNAIMAKGEAPRCGEIASFGSYTDDGRLILKERGEDVVVTPVGELANAELSAGDRVRWSRSTLLGLERVEPKNGGKSRLLEHVPETDFDDVGGLEEQIAALRSCIALHVDEPDAVARFQLPRKRSVLLVGPPGTGKTLLARAIAGEIKRRGGHREVRFTNVKPGEMNSVWFGQSEENIRRLFQDCRKLALEDPNVPLVMFLDEVDAIAGSRGHRGNHVGDRVLLALATELDGLDENENIFIVAATNRRDAIDPAIARPGRLGDLVLEIGRPSRRGAISIFEKHLPAGIPYEPQLGVDPARVREDLIESIVSRIYAPNSKREPLVTLGFRDGKQRGVEASHLITGALIKNLCESALELACLRNIEDGVSGLSLSDLLTALDSELVSGVAVLTPANCRGYLEGLPDDVDVVSINRPLGRRAARGQPSLNLA